MQVESTTVTATADKSSHKSAIPPTFEELSEYRDDVTAHAQSAQGCQSGFVAVIEARQTVCRPEACYYCRDDKLGRRTSACGMALRTLRDDRRMAR